MFETHRDRKFWYVFFFVESCQKRKSFWVKVSLLKDISALTVWRRVRVNVSSN